MEAIDRRVEQAEALWRSGLAAERSGDFTAAYRHYTDAHDLIMDCARLHQRAHEHLRRVNRELGNHGEWITDWLLHCLAPLGVFELVSRLSGTGAFGSAVCRRGRAQ